MKLDIKCDKCNNNLTAIEIFDEYNYTKGYDIYCLNCGKEIQVNEALFDLEDVNNFTKSNFKNIEKTRKILELFYDYLIDDDLIGEIYPDERDRNIDFFIEDNIIKLKKIIEKDK